MHTVYGTATLPATSTTIRFPDGRTIPVTKPDEIRAARIFRRQYHPSAITTPIGGDL